LLVGDEPTGNLDSRTSEDVFQLFSTLVDQGKTILMVTHDKELAHRVPRVIEITDGQITRDDHSQVDTPHAVGSTNTCVGLCINPNMAGPS
jgi:putative ABC transport system ATP-binding protein